MALTRLQKAFIRSKVKKLGSFEQVKLFYNRDDLVCQYAEAVSERVYKNGKVKR